MTKNEAESSGYCKHCAAYGGKKNAVRWRCGCTLPYNKEAKLYCQLPATVAERFRSEFGLEGETRRFQKTEFGNRDILPKPRTRRKKRFNR